MTATSYALPGSRHGQIHAAIREWTIKRGVLALFLLLPAAVLLVSFVLRLASLPVAAFALFVSFDLIVAWVSYRLSVSDDPDEPVRHLHRYALDALLPIAVFSLVQIPAVLAAGVVYWQLWNNAGAELIRESSSQSWALAAGMVLYVLVGMGLMMSYYVLAQKNTLLNAVAFLGVLAPGVFLSLFSIFSVAGAYLSLAWYGTFWIASLVGSVSAWSMPKFWPWVKRALGGWRLLAVVAATTLLVATPFTFAAERSVTWQVGERQRIDHAAFNQIAITAQAPLVFASQSGQTAHYDGSLRFGPRTFANMAGIVRLVDASPVTIEGRLLAAGETVAWCTGYVSKIASANTIQDPKTFLAAAQRLDFVEVPVTCAGPADVIPTLCAPDAVTMVWEADAVLIGDGTSQERRYTGQHQTTLEFPAGSACA